MTPIDHTQKPRDEEAVRRWRAAVLADLEPKIIDIGPEGKPARKRMSDWTLKESCQALFALMVLGLVVPFVILFGGIIALAMWDSITSR